MISDNAVIDCKLGGYRKSSSYSNVDRSLILKIPYFGPEPDWRAAIVHSTGGVAADANDFPHPLGNHAQVSFVIDGQPIKRVPPG